MKFRLVLLALALLSGVAIARGHDHWIMLDMDADDALRMAIRVGSGHLFPRSDTLLARHLLTDTMVFGPDGLIQPFTPEAQGNAWVAQAVAGQPGVWTASFVLRRPQQTEPLHRGRALVVIGDHDDPDRYFDGQGLEVVPVNGLAGLSAGDVLPLRIMEHGQFIAGTIAVKPEHGAGSFLSTTPERPAQLRVASRGAYLLTVTHQGQTFSLTVRAGAGEAERNAM